MDMSGVQFDNNDPESLGWPRNTGYVPYTWTDPKTGVGYLFPQGIYQGTGPLWDDLLNTIVPLIGIPGEQGIHPGGFGVAGTWGAEDKQNTNNGALVSFHACGRALDINAPWNPNGQGAQDGQPWGMPTAIVAICRSKGFLSGIEFGDGMHIELHLTPAEIAVRLAELNGVVAAGPSPSTPTPTTPAPTSGGTTVTPEQMQELLDAIAGDRQNSQNEIRAQVGHATTVLMQDNRGQVAALSAALSKFANTVTSGLAAVLAAPGVKK